jgi:DNA-binding NarL/FixJ family response regulator
MTTTVGVAILDDHQAILDGCRYRLSGAPDIRVVATAAYWSEMESLLAARDCDVLLMDINVPASPDNPLPFPILSVIVRLGAHYPELAIVIFSMSAEPAFVRAAIQAGAGGYILKEDATAMQQLAAVVRAVAAGDAYLSDKAQHCLQAATDEAVHLTRRQLQLLSLLAFNPDLKLEVLAEECNVAASTVRNLLSDAYRRLGVTNRGSAILRMRQLGLATAIDEKWPES